MSGSLLARVLLLLVLVPVSLGGATPAAAHDESVHTWSTSVTEVCVESTADTTWAVKRAVRQWNRIPGGPTFVLATSCPDYEGTVTVRDQSSDSHYTGWTDWFWDGTGHLVHADIILNPQRVKAFDRRDQACMRKHTASHELGHALGLRHYPHSHAGSVMSYLGWQQRCGRPSVHDRSDFRELYPQAVLPAAAPA